MPTTLLIGHSHLLALLDAALAQAGRSGERVRTIPDRAMWETSGGHPFDVDLPGGRCRFLLLGAFAPPFLQLDGRGLPSVRRLHTRLLDEAADALGGSVDRVLSCCYGNAQWVFSLMEHPVPFDVLLDADDVGVGPAGDRPRQVIPATVVRRELAALARPTVFAAAVLRARFPDATVAHLAPPPPVADDQHIRAHPELFSDLIARFGIAPAALRRKVHRAYLEELATALAAEGVATIDAPGAAVDDGFLRPELCQGATHGNEAYGALVLDQTGLC